ncbi:MAG: hypothetical protein ACK4MM_07380, partial [Fervidobacterium sp.]
QYFDLENQNNVTRLNSLTGKTGLKSDTSEFIQPVMIGIGESVYSGDKFFEACEGHLGINMVDISSLPNELKSDSVEKRYKDVNKCILESGTIPFYKYGRLQGQTILLAKILDGTGPVFISPGFGYNKLKFDPNIVSPLGSFSTFKLNCENCLVVATINYGDFETLDYYKQYDSEWNSIDVIAFTVNISSLSSCEPIIVIVGENSIKAFAQNITEKYHKPVMVIVSGSEGDNVVGNCTWTNVSIAKFHDYLIRYIPELTSSGVIAVISSDSSQLPSEAYNSFGMLCSIYYSAPTPKFNFASYSIFSNRGDVPSLCDLYNKPTSMFMLGDILNYSSIQLIPTQKEEKCTSKLFYDLQGLSQGVFFTSYCSKDNESIFNLASKHFLDTSLYMAVIAKLGYYQSDSLGEYEHHCSTLCDQYLGKEKELCCLAETMVYYRNKTLNKKSSIDDLSLAYFVTYGTLRGESAFNQELNKIISGNFLSSDKNKISQPIFLSSKNSSSVQFQTNSCEYYSMMCQQYQSYFYCSLYDEFCKEET